jgi:peptide/nickel transport system permease protein
MRAYLFRRLLLVIPSVFIISAIIFLLMRLVPGDIVDGIMARMEEAGEVSEIDETILARQFGLDAPLIVQYGRFLGVTRQADGVFAGLMQGHLGISWTTRDSVTERVLSKLPVTMELGLFSLIISQLIAIPIGVVSALRQDTAADYIGRSFAILFISVPSFWLGTVVILFASVWWGYLPPIRWTAFSDDPIKNLSNIMVPAVINGLLMAGGTMRMMRTMMLEVLRQDYVRTAWSKGLRERVVVYRHALRNALIPVVTIVGLQIPILIGGTVIIEQLFTLPGMGQMIIDALRQRDYPTVNGVMVITSFTIVVVNLMVDITYGIIDPKVKYQ